MESDIISGVFDGTAIPYLILESSWKRYSRIWGQTAETSVIRNTNFINIYGPEAATTSFGIVGFNEGLIENCFVEMIVTQGGTLDIKLAVPS